MNNKLNHSLAIYICAFICWLVPSIIWASVEVDGIYYDLNTTAKTAAVASNPNYYSGAIDIPSSFVYNGSTYNVKSIGSRAFLNCSELISITFPNSVTTIGSSAFERCTGLTDVVIGDGVTFIDYEAFKNCSSLSSLTLPSSLKTIENETFSGCTSLSEIIAKRTTPPTIVSTTFDGVDKTACMIYVPEGCQSTYASATNWKAFTNIVERTVVAYDGCGANVTYTIYSDMTMVISGTGNMDMLLFADHPTYDGYCHSIKKVIIEEGVSGIGPYAFNECTGMISVTIPSTVNEIFTTPFAGSISLTTMTVASGNTTYDSRDNCNAIIETSTNTLIAGCKNSIIPISVTSIGDGAFSQCTGLTSVTIPNSVTSIGKNAFNSCTGLTSVIVEGETPASVGKNAFYRVDKTNCTLYVPIGSKTAYESAEGWSEFQNIVEYVPGQEVLASGSCGDNVTYTIYSDKSMVISGTGAMTNFTINYDDDTINRENNEYWSQVKTVTIEEGVTSIGNYAFSNCTELTSVSIPNSMTSIGTFAFLGCSVLTSITIPASVETIGADALSYTGLTHIYIEDCDDVLRFEQVAFDMDDYEDPLEYVYLGRNISTIDFHEFDLWYGVGGYPPFSRSRNLHTLEIGDKVTYLEDWSFNSAPLQSLVIGSNVQSIGIRALSSANAGQTLVIPSNVNRMGAFSLSPNISTLVLEKGSDDLELLAGYNSQEISFYESESSIDSIYVGRNLTCSSNNIHVVCRSACFDASLRRTMNTSGEEEEFDLTEYYIPPVCATKYYFRSGASVGEYYFQNSPVEHIYNLSSSRVGNYAFFNSNVKTVSFDADGSTTIGNSVFSGCNGLTTLSFPEGMTDIGDNAFMDCYGLTSITIPNSLKSIGGDCFFMDDTERNVSFNVYISDLSAWCSMDIGWGGSPLIWGHLMYNGEEITDLVVPDDVQSIGMGAFDGYSSLTSVLIPESVTSIGDRAFYCTGLTSVTIESTVPLTIDGSTFEGVDKTNCILYVPFGSKSAYEEAAYWSEFENIVENGEEPDTDISALDNAIYVDQIESRIGGTMDIPVKLKNSYPVRGFQFTLELPEGVNINSWALNTNRLPSGATLSDKIATQKIEGNKITVACSLNYGDATFIGNDGEIATVNVTFGDDMEVGTYPIYLTACDVTTASGVDEDLSDVKATLVLEDYVVGDANGDGKVRIGDATTILNYIVGAPSDNFKEKAADANGDGKIRIGDATTILNIIVNQ